MATEALLDLAGFDAFQWDAQGAGLYAGAAIAGGNAAGSSLGASRRGGVIQANGTPLKYVFLAGMNATVKAGAYLLPSADPARGMIPVVLAADVTLTHTTSSGSNPRTDLIIIEVNDQGTTASTKKVKILQGTAGVGAPAPAAPTGLGNGGYAILASVYIGVSVSTLTSITDLRTFTAAAGAVVPVANAAAAAALPPGTPYYDLSLDREGVVRANGVVVASPLTLPWGGASRYPMTGPISGIINTTYATLTVASAAWYVDQPCAVFIRALIDVQMFAAGACIARISGMPESEDTIYDIGATSRQPMRLSAMLYLAAPGVLTLNLEIAVFTGSVTVNSIKWMVYAKGAIG